MYDFNECAKAGAGYSQRISALSPMTGKFLKSKAAFGDRAALASIRFVQFTGFVSSERFKIKLIEEERNVPTFRIKDIVVCGRPKLVLPATSNLSQIDDAPGCRTPQRYPR